ncbi:hypothetical protein BHE74_00020863 [Ensete ventricosum]|nr:hypothetical protein BHE74_00020863 [Ensete ventricosum]
MGAMGRTSTLVLITTAAIDLDRVRSSSVVSGVEGRGIERFAGEPWVFWKISSRKRGRRMDWTAPSVAARWTTSVYSGFLGMKIATFANARTTLEARKRYDWECLCESMMGYGLGGSLMPLSGRVGGGMYTKAADVGAFLVGKAERNILEDCQGTLCGLEDGRRSSKALQIKSWTHRWKDKARVCNLLCQDDKMSTDASLKKMIPPDALVILTPLVVGNFFGVHTCTSCWLTGFCWAALGRAASASHRWCSSSSSGKGKMAKLGTALTEVLIPLAAVIGIGFAVLQWILVSRIRLSSEPVEKNGRPKNLVGREPEEEEEGVDGPASVAKCAEIQSAISIGGFFMVIFGVIIFLFLGSVKGFSKDSQPCTYSKDRICKPALANAAFSTLAFLLGSLTSVLSGFLGMKIATYANARTTVEARKGVGRAFIVAFRSGAVMGFLLAANGLLVLYISINLFKIYYGDDWEGLYESITGYGLGGSSMALFGRVGGGIYTKAADVGADLVGKVERNIPEDDPRNPAVIADNVGDNVGDIAGMGSDLFGSYAESTCAALFVGSISSFGVDHDFSAMSYPLLISSMGIIVCLFTTLVATDLFEIKSVKQIEPSLKWQLVISTVLMTGGIAIVSFVALPSKFTLFNFGEDKTVKNW